MKDASQLKRSFTLMVVENLPTQGNLPHLPRRDVVRLGELVAIGVEDLIECVGVPKQVGDRLNVSPAFLIVGSRLLHDVFRRAVPWRNAMSAASLFRPVSDGLDRRT
jgi:hypothetical protein